MFSFSVSDPENDPLSVSINHDKKFYLEEETTTRGSYTVKLKERLDRETENRYALVITIDDSNGHAVGKWGGNDEPVYFIVPKFIIAITVIQ